MYLNDKGERVFEQDDWREEGNRRFRDSESGPVVTSFEEIDPTREESHDYWEENERFWERFHLIYRQNHFLPSHATLNGPKEEDLSGRRDVFMRNTKTKRDVLKRDTYQNGPQKIESFFWIGRTRFWKKGFDDSSAPSKDEVVEYSEDDTGVNRPGESTVDRLRREATQISHLLTHHPKNPFCKCCTYGKAASKPLRRKDPANKVEWAKIW